MSKISSQRMVASLSTEEVLNRKARMARAASPALSENEVDITKSLFQDSGFGSDDEDLGLEPRAQEAQAAREIIQDGESEDDEAFIAATQAAANRKNDSKTAKKAGAFKGMGLNEKLLKSIQWKGFTKPTPIQQKTMPLILDGRDVVGMARTGSGKTAAFVIPMIEKLKSHSAKVGARAIVLSPSRELALQTLKVIKAFGKGTDLRTTLLVGGESLEDQFSSMASNPDIIIATPGRFEHLKVEMGLELSSVRYVVFDEADRLFEMGFAAQLLEIMHSLPPSRQTLLFSATLPTMLRDFARAGLQDPVLCRLDAESKLPPGLQSAFFTIKRGEKEGALLHVLQDVIQMPIGDTDAAKAAKDPKPTNGKKRKRGADVPSTKEAPSKHSTVVFAATKHHVEYLANLLKAFGYATSYVYGSLDQTARQMQVQDFRTGMTNILVVTDVAARGLDIPVLANVINYDFPSQPKIFVHRVGRTARAGKTGWSYSLVAQQDLPYLLDLELFLNLKLVMGRAESESNMYSNCIVAGDLVRDQLERCCEETAKIVEDDEDLLGMREVAQKGEKQYLRTRNAAPTECVKKAKKLSQSGSSRGTNLLFDTDQKGDAEQQRLDMLAKVSGFRPQETVFEIGKRGTGSEAAEIMRKRRAKVAPKHRAKGSDEDANEQEDAANGGSHAGSKSAPVDMDFDCDDDLVLTRPNEASDSDASDSEDELTLSGPNESHASGNANKWQDTEHFMCYTPTTLNLAEDRGYGVHSGGTNAQSDFLSSARDVTMDLANDESKSFAEASKAGQGLRWDKKGKKYVSRANDQDGSKGAKMIRGESGQKIAASFRSGRFDAWRKANKVDRLPRVGEMERANAHFASSGGRGGGGGRGGRGGFRHKQEKAPKAADKYRDDYDSRKKRVEAAKEKRVGRFAEGKGKSEIRGVDDVRRLRKVEQKRKEKNARPTRR